MPTHVVPLRRALAISSTNGVGDKMRARMAVPNNTRGQKLYGASLKDQL